MIISNKKLGQNFLLDKNIITKEIKASNVSKQEIILEIGGGYGVLTDSLLKNAKKVICVEIDKNLIVHLKNKFKDQIKSGKLKLIKGDILKIKIPYFDKCVSNIPYSLSSPLIFHLLKFQKPLYLMMQKEFAERLFTKKAQKNYSHLGVISGIYFDGKICFFVSKNVFRPKPKTDSAFVELIPKKKIIVKNRDKKMFFLFIKTIFCRKKQNLKKVIAESFNIKKDVLSKIEEEHNLDLSKKTYQYDADELLEVYKKIVSCCIYKL